MAGFGEGDVAPHYLRYLPDRDIAQIIDSLDSLSRAALRASCKANKAVVDAHVQEARYYGVARHPRHEVSLPPFIRRVQIHALGPPTQEWLCRSLAGLHNLTHLHLTAERAREDELLRRERRPPDRIGPILLLHHLSTSNLTELHIDDLGMNVRYTREKQWRALIPPKEKVDKLAKTLQSFRLSEEYRMYKNLFQCLVVPLTNLRNLDLGASHFGFLPPYATHELSRMTALTSLRFSFCQAMLSSHVAPLYTITSLKSLDLGDVQFRESAAEFEEQDPLVQPLRLSTMDKGTQQFVVSLRQLTGWGPQEPVGMGASTTPLPQAGGRAPHPARFILLQLGRCTGLECLAIAGWELPDEEDIHGEPSDFDVGSNLLAHLTNLTALDLDAAQTRTLPYIARMPHLKSLSYGVSELDSEAGNPETVDLSDMLDALAQASLLPQLCSLRLPEPFTSRAFGLSSLRQLSAVTNLDLQYLSGEDEWSELAAVGLNSICAADMFREGNAPKLQRLVICGWWLPQASALSPLTGLVELDISDTLSDDAQTHQPMLAWLNWPPDLFSQLAHLKKLTCKYTHFGDDQLVRALTCSPSLQVLHAKGCRVSELGVLRASHPGAARASLQKFYRRLYILKQHHPELYSSYMLHQQGLPDMLPSLKPDTDLSQELTHVEPLPVRAPLVELDLSSQVEDPPFSSNSEPRARRKDSIGDAAALALAVCLPGLRSLTLRECPRLSSAGWLALASLSSLTYLDVRRCNVAGRELSLLASNQASPDALASALTCIDELALGFCARISDPHESWLPAGAGGARRDDVSQAAGAGEGGASGSRGHARGQESLEEEEEQRCVPTQLGGADPMEVEPAAEASTHSTRGCGVTPLKDVSHEWIARMRRCVCAGQPKFPALTKLVATDDRTELEKVIHKSDVDAVADAVARGSCSLRELHVDRGEEFDEVGSHTEGSSEAESQMDEGESSEWVSEDEVDAPHEEALPLHQPAVPAHSGSSSDGSSRSGESEWEEMEWGKDKDADAAAEAKLEVKKLPALLQVPDCQRWLDAGLLVVRAADIMEDDDDGGV